MMRSHSSEVDLYGALLKNGFYSKNRPLLETVLDNLFPGLNVVQLPTGYGKTALPVVHGLYSIIDPGRYVRALHVLPLRSIVDDAYKSTKNGLQKLGLENVEDLISQQMMGVPGSPFLNRKLVFVTFETFRLHMMKAPPPEIKNLVCPSIVGSSGWKTFGHFEIGRGAIFESAVFIDEPQLITETENEQASFSSLIHALAGFHIYLVLMSATVSRGLRNMVRDASEKFGVNYNELIYGENIRDRDFDNMMSSKEVRTSTTDEPLVEVVKKKIGEKVWKRILVLVNTVEQAKRIYGAVIHEGPVILHGKMTKRDRVSALERLKGERWIAVATQVVEAGVNISAELLVTEVAPASSLVQRAGRVARYDWETEGEIVVVKGEDAPYVPEDVEKTWEILRSCGSAISWRLPIGENGMGYSQFVEAVHNKPIDGPVNQLLNQMLNPWSTPEQTIPLLLKNEMTSVYVSRNDEPLCEEDAYQTDFQSFAQRHPNAKAVVYDEEGLGVDRYTAGQILRFPFPALQMMCRGIVGFEVSEVDYRHEAYGV